MTTSWPRAERWSDVGQPQKPSPPRIRMRKKPSVEMAEQPRDSARTAI
jgi:hypothetical protein